MSILIFLIIDAEFWSILVHVIKFFYCLYRHGNCTIPKKRGIQMKVVILAGGLGTRLSEETHLKPKPMVEIGGKPILWHIMKSYSNFGYNEFIICCGYKGYIIKEYFANYLLHNSDVTINLKDRSIDMHANNSEPWKVTLIDTGEETLTAGRLKKLYPFLKDEKQFFFTYGDGLSDINFNKLNEFHKKHRKISNNDSNKTTW